MMNRYGNVPYAQAEDVDRAIMNQSEQVKRSPSWKGDGSDFPDVPEPIAEVGKEASACHSAEHYRGAVMLARAVIEATAKSHGAKGQLFAKIEELGKKRILSPMTVVAAHAIRGSGNAVAQGDFVE